MQPRIKMGLAIGAVGLALNVCVAGFIGLCGPLVSLDQLPDTWGHDMEWPSHLLGQ